MQPLLTALLLASSLLVAHTANISLSTALYMWYVCYGCKSTWHETGMEYCRRIGL